MAVTCSGLWPTAARIFYESAVLWPVCTNGPAETRSLTPPEGYQVQQVYKVDASPFKEADITAGLKAFAELSGGTYPDGLDMAEELRAHHNLVTRLLKDNSDGKGLGEKLQAYEPGNAAIIRMLVYIDNPTFGSKLGSDWHYAGAGVKFGQADRPIFWYLPAGAANYRVINGDLSVHDVAAADLPKVPSKVVANPSKLPATRP